MSQQQQPPPPTKGLCTIWEDNSPDSLIDLAAQCVLRNPHTIFCLPEGGGGCRLRRERLAAVESGSTDDDGGGGGDQPLRLIQGLHLPTEICEKLLSTLGDLGLELDDGVAGAFGDLGSRCKLKRLNLRHSSVTSGGLCSLLRSNHVRELDVVGCRQMSPQALETLNSHSSYLVELNLSMASEEDGGFVWNAATDDDDVGCLLPKRVVTDWGWARRLNGGGGSGPGPDLDLDDVAAVVEEEADDEWDEEDKALMKYAKRGYILNAPALQRLYMRDVALSGPEYFPLLFNRLKNLTHLDLSNCRHREGMSNYEWLPRFFGGPDGHLVYLVLHNTEITEEAVTENVVRLGKLRHLDISQCERGGGEGSAAGYYHNPDAVLSRVVRALPGLTSVDISGTNLAGVGLFRWSSDDNDDSGGGGSSGEVNGAPSVPPLDEDGEQRPLPKCDIRGLVDRVDRPLEFLGLYKTMHEASSRAHIPAKQVSGDFDEAQIVVAGQHYLNRPAVMERVLNDLYQIFRFENGTNHKAALDVILRAMDRHPLEKGIQLSGSASMYFVLKGGILDKINAKVKRKILSTVLNGMYAHKDDPMMMRNGYLTLSLFQIPQDFTEYFERLVRIVLYMVSYHGVEESSFLQQSGICLLNNLACQVDGEQKLLVGDMGAIEKILALIRMRLRAKLCDNAMETAWSTMWNVTDETPTNCRRFIDGNGMKLFLLCKAEFPDKENLLRNMMGLLGNVAEVPSLRPQLMTKSFVSQFSNLLDSTLDGIEVSYNAASVLAHMASDGPEAWTIDEPSREEVVGKMVGAIERWKLSSPRNINYRSFEPILRLVKVTHTPECQHWAIWALANLTKVDVKYCSLIEKEGGLTLLEEIISGEEAAAGRKPYKRVIELAAMVRDNVARWKERNSAR